MKYTHVCAAQTFTALLFTKYIEPDFPSLADEIAEPYPDMNIKVTAFAVSERSINMFLYLAPYSPTSIKKVRCMPIDMKHVKQGKSHFELIMDSLICESELIFV